MSGRGKGKLPVMPSFPGEMFALGKSGSSSNNKRDNSSSDRSGASNYSKKSKSSSSSNVSGDRGQSHSSRALERGSASSGSVGVSNIGRDGSGIGDRSGGIAGVITEHGGGRHHHDKTHVWETLAHDVDSEHLVNRVADAHNQDDKEAVESYLCGAVKSLRSQRAKPDQSLYLSLLYLVKIPPYSDYFTNSEYVLEAFCSLLKRDVKESYKSKGNALVSVLAANILMTAYRNITRWPEIFVKIYIEDAMSERVWVDHPEIKYFVDNICTAFETNLPTQHHFTSGGFFVGPGTASNTGKTSVISGANISSGNSGAGLGTNLSEGGSGSGGGSGGRSSPQGGSRSGSGSATPTRPAHEDITEVVDASGSSMVLNAASYVLSSQISEKEGNMDISSTVPVIPRYTDRRGLIEQIVMEAVKEHLNRRQGTDNITRNFIKFLTSVCGLIEVRLIVVPKLEMWIMNPKVSRAAQELLMAVAMNCTTHTNDDVEVITNNEVITNFLKLRFKNKPNINLYLACIKELANANRDVNLPTLIKLTIFNELSNARNPNNMQMLNVMFGCGQLPSANSNQGSSSNDLAAASLAAVFVDLLLQKECYLRALRALLREIVRALRYDTSLNLHTFCYHLMNLDPKAENQVREFEFKERFLTSVVDLVTLSMFLCVSPSVRDSMNSYMRGDRKNDIGIYKNFLKQVSMIQRDGVIWMYENVISIFKPENTTTYPQSLHKLIFIANPEEYWRTDGWPIETERNILFKAVTDIPVLEDTLIHLFAIGVSKAHPINGRDTIELAEYLIKRASALYQLVSDDFAVLKTDKVTQIMELLFQLSAYSYPDSIALPTDYSPPSMAISIAYWKAWQILVILCAHNPLEFGKLAWETYPTLRACMEMCITNQFNYFPPPTLAPPGSEQADEHKARELQISAIERQEILDFETQLAAATNKATITESTSLLLAQLITMDPAGPLRKPRQEFLDSLQNSNQRFKIGHLLCRSRNPDFLLDILQRQGQNQAMPWLADLVESSEGSFNVLPVQCLCEFLLNSACSSQSSEEENSEKENSELTVNNLLTGENGRKKAKQKQLLLHLQNLLQNPAGDQRASEEMLEYFLRRLSSQQTYQRIQALKGLRLVLTPIMSAADQMEVDDGSNDIVDGNNDWLMKRLPALPCFPHFYSQISHQLRFACQVENDPNAVSLYVQFLAHYAPDNLPELADLCLDMSSTIVERSTLLPAILPGSMCKTELRTANETYLALLRLFVQYMDKVRTRGEDATHSAWSENQEMITVVWQSVPAWTATVHFFVVHAQIILLTYGPLNVNENTSKENIKMQELFNHLLSMWHPVPRAYLMDTSEEAILIPDWLKLKMIRSDVEVLVDSALHDLEPDQLVLFIQSFGIPVASMSKLLSALDKTVVSEFAGVNKAVMDKTYMGQLVMVQHERGATGGKVFAEKLGLNLTPSIKLSDQRSENDSSSSILSEIKRQPPKIPPKSTAMIPPSQVKNTLQSIFEVGSSNSMTRKEKQDAFRLLQKNLSSEICKVSEVITSKNLNTIPLLDATVKGFEQILKSNDLRPTFVKAMVEEIPFSCALYRLISTAFLSRATLRDSPVSELLLKISNNILTELKTLGQSDPIFAQKTRNSPLQGLVDDYVVKKKKSKRRQTEEKELAKSSVKIKEEPEEDKHFESFRCLKEASDSTFEDQIHLQVKSALKSNSTNQIVNTLSKLLLEEEGNDAKTSTFNNTKVEQHSKEDIKDNFDSCAQKEMLSTCNGKSGLLMDWLQLLDPELVNVDPSVKHKILFSKTKVLQPNLTSKANAKPQLLLTMLTHQASWESLRKMIDDVLIDNYTTENENSISRGGRSSQNSNNANSCNLNPSSVLDFLTTCVYLQKRWHSADGAGSAAGNHVPKHDNVPKDVLCLNNKQVFVMVDYILKEMLQVIQGMSQPDESTINNSMREIALQRAPLIIGSMASTPNFSSKQRASAIVDHLFSKLISLGGTCGLSTNITEFSTSQNRRGHNSSISANGIKESTQYTRLGSALLDLSLEKHLSMERCAIRELLLQIYMKVPHCILHLVEAYKSATYGSKPEEEHFMFRIFPPPGYQNWYCSSSERSISNVDNNASRNDSATQISVVDNVSHTLLSSLAATQAGRAWAQQMQEFESAARKVAATHPVLMLRNLPLIAASLRGRTQYDFSFFRSRNYLTLYNMMLGLMELMAPFIFSPEYKQALQESMICYFEMMNSYFIKKDSISGLIDKFIVFVHLYIEHQPIDAIPFIRSQGSRCNFVGYQAALPNMHSLRQLCSIIDFSEEAAENLDAAGQLELKRLINPSGATKYRAAERATLAIDADRFVNAINMAVSRESEDELVHTLQELKQSSNSKPAVLVSITEELTDLIRHPNRIIRTIAYELTLRLLRHSPNTSSDIVPSYMMALESPDQGIVISALEKLPDIAPLVQEKITSIMQVAFCLGLYSNLTVTSYISETISVLNAQAGY